ncbi:MAG: GNAT family N-acetyltransferase [Defluviitaleaceae bacterium]|nr:GNAT family N-acetyltransferase [Defluviitaleaceae bacterium]
MTKIKLRQAKPREATTLTGLAFKAKAHWGYPKDWLDLWVDDLTITQEYIKNNMVTVADADGEVVGFVSIAKYDGDFFLDNLFVDPSYMGKGVGKKLLSHALDYCKQTGITRLTLYSDPNAKGFYESNGGVYLGEHPSAAIPNRTLPIFTYNLHETI